MAVMCNWMAVWRPAGLGLVGLWAGLSWAEPRVQCTLSYAGETRTVQAGPVQDSYAVASVDVRGRFRFKPVVVGTGDRIERINFYVYQLVDGEPVMLQQAKYLPPFHWPANGSPLPLTGQQHLYAGPMERELIYSCTLHRSAS